MHILQIYKDYFPVLGGIENHVRELSAALAERGHRVTVLVTSRDHATSIAQPHANMTVIRAARTFYAASTPFSAAMFAHAWHLRPDLVHLHVPYPPGDIVARCVPGHPPLIVTYHSDIVRQKNLLRAYRPLLEATLEHATTIIATSPNYIVSSPFLQKHASKCMVVPLGIDIERFADAKISKSKTQNSKLTIAEHSQLNTQNSKLKTLLFVGRLRYYKGLHVLLDALPLVDAELLVGGTGPEQARLEAQAARLGVADRVRWLGDVADADLPALYHSADVFVLPAHLRAEALGLALIEAMASGLPCISTELGTGTSFVNKDGETGLVVPPADPAALAMAINMLLADAALRQRYGAAAHERAHSLFSRERMVDSVERVYADALRARTSSKFKVQNEE